MGIKLELFGQKVSVNGTVRLYICMLARIGGNKHGPFAIEIKYISTLCDETSRCDACVNEM